MFLRLLARIADKFPQFDPFGPGDISHLIPRLWYTWDEVPVGVQVYGLGCNATDDNDNHCMFIKDEPCGGGRWWGTTYRGNIPLAESLYDDPVIDDDGPFEEVI